MKYLIVVLITAAVGSGTFAQQPATKAAGELVTVPVVVTGRDRANFITGLTPKDFRVSENGQPQEVTAATRLRGPLSLSIVVDSSATMARDNRRELAIEAAQRIVAALRPDDEISIVFLGRTLDVKVPWTRVANIAELNWTGWNPLGVTPLHEGMRLVLDLIERAHNPHHAIVLLTDGFENSSRTSLANLVKTRRQSETALYGFGLGLLQPAKQARVMNPSNIDADDLRKFDIEAPSSIASTNAIPDFDYLETLVGDSGGMVARMPTMPEATMAAKNLVAELDNQYLVSYVSSKPLDGKYRKIKVEVERRGLYVRHRGGYLAQPFVLQ